ncbi:HAD family hydrolase [Carboxylicivirga linearis]|uniref:Haloacid dehalogenase-like hydrolase n=1 Tax=Carboxylicivirga linearis TaxID=1628157 RepID=A0ABS5JXU9_9BACT|nr:HAD family hydrolase [Carboxylicivirga linearis]MBS2099727.1 haloacid dehalogenase-like hydrolase [Carboxylicivirga linearis]
MRNKLWILISLIFIGFACSSPVADNSTPPADQLPSWNDGKVKKEIFDFVDAVTDPESPTFVEIPDRIAVFDNDGTLWSEQPLYFQLFFVIYQIKKMAPDHPEWITEQPFKAILDDDMATLKTFGMKELLELVMTTHAGITSVEFENAVMDWLHNDRHPSLKKPFTKLVYQPMLELMNYLRDNDFKVFIVSGGGIDFMRPWAEEVYGIPRNQVVGSSIVTQFELKDGEPVLVRMPELNFIDDKEGKPVGIYRHIGRKPIFCGGNSDGDLQMMQYTDSGKGKRMMLYIHHTDAEREWAYDRDSHIGRFNKALDEATEKGWTIVNMKTDWKVIYPE